MVTIYDVAKEANVSTSSVSRYLNSPGMVKPETQQRIRLAIEKLKYRPNALAVSMRTQQTQNIALVIPSITNMYYIDLYTALREAVKKYGYSLHLFTTEREDDELRKALDSVINQNYAGIILGFLDEPGVRKDIERTSRDIPMVLITSDPSQEKITNVFLDARDALTKATNHLIDLGRKQIAYIGAAPNSIISSEKYIGFTRAIEAAGFEVDLRHVFHGARQHFTTGFAATANFLALDQKPDGIVCATDDIGIGCIKQLLVNKIDIPGEIAVASFNGISVLNTYEPELTTVAQPIKKMVDTSVRMLMDKIESKNTSERVRVTVTGTLIVRKSTVA